MNESPDSKPSETPLIDEHGNPSPVMYRIPFDGKDAYFYAESAYRSLERSLTALQSENEQLRKERDNWMDSWHKDVATLRASHAEAVKEREALTTEHIACALAGAQFRNERDTALAEIERLKGERDELSVEVGKCLKDHAETLEQVESLTVENAQYSHDVADLRAELAEAKASSVIFSAELDPDTRRLVLRFAQAVADKLRKSEEKYGFKNEWMMWNWVGDGTILTEFEKHVDKGDPVEVAIYCAFLWWHQQPTKIATISTQAALIAEMVFDMELMRNRLSKSPINSAPGLPPLCERDFERWDALLTRAKQPTEPGN